MEKRFPRPEREEPPDEHQEWLKKIEARDRQIMELMEKRKAGMPTQTPASTNLPDFSPITNNPFAAGAEEHTEPTEPVTVFEEDGDGAEEIDTGPRVDIAPLFGDGESELFQKPDFTNLFAGLGSIDAFKAPPAQERKDRDLPTFEEKAFFQSFLSDFRTVDLNGKDKKILVEAGNLERRRIIRETAGLWAHKILDTTSRLEMLFTEQAFKGLFLPPEPDPMGYIFGEQLFPTYLLGKMKRRGQKFENRIALTDENLANMFLETYSRIFGQELGVIDKTISQSTKYFSIVVNEDVLPTLKENESVKGMRFYEAIFPEEREKTRIRKALFWGYVYNMFVKEKLANGTRYSITARTKDPEQKKKFATIMGHWGEVVESPSQVRVYMPMEEVEFVDQPFGEVVSSAKEAAACFAGKWLALDLPEEFAVVDKTVVATIAKAVNDCLGERLVGIRYDGKRLAATEFNRQKLITKLKELLGEAIPYFDDLFPQAA